MVLATLSCNKSLAICKKNLPNTGNYLYNIMGMKIKAGKQMKVSKKRLSMIGKLIGIYREERRNNTWNHYTLKSFCEGICSINTLKNVERGNISRSKDVYVELLRKLDIKFGEFPIIDTALDALIDDLYIAVEYYDSEKIAGIANKAFRLLSEVKDYVYYSEMISIIKSIKAKYVDDILIDQQCFKRYDKLLDIMPYKIKNILKILIYSKYRFDHIGNPKAISREFERLHFEGEYGCFGILQLDYYYLNDQFLDLHVAAEKLETYFTETHNVIKLLDVYNYQIASFNDANSQLNQDYINKVIAYIEAHRLPDLKISEIYYNLASLYYRNSSYELAMRYFEKVIFYDPNALLPEYLFIADCQNHLDKSIDIPKIAEDVLDRYPQNLINMYKYFTLGEVPDFIKQDFIMKKILPDLCDAYYIRMFRYELENLVSRTNHYKTIYLFDKVVSSNIS